jgi:hypothetical protein
MPGHFDGNKKSVAEAEELCYTLKLYQGMNYLSEKRRKKWIRKKKRKRLSGRNCRSIL